MTGLGSKKKFPDIRGKMRVAAHRSGMKRPQTFDRPPAVTAREKINTLDAPTRPTTAIDMSSELRLTPSRDFPKIRFVEKKSASERAAGPARSSRRTFDPPPIPVGFLY